MKDIIQTQFTEADVTKVEQIITNLETEIAGKTETLSEDERVRYGSINEQNKLIVNKAWQYRQSQPALSAPNVDWAEFEKDFNARNHLENWINRLKALVHSLESTKIKHDYDNFQDALKDYGYSQYQKGAGEDGYDVKVEEFKTFFQKSPRSQPPANEDDNGDGETNP